MKVTSYLLVVLVLSGIISLSNSSKSFSKGTILEKFQNEPKELFKAFYVLFERENSYDLNSPQGVKRFKIFQENLNFINSENQKAGKKVYGITQFTDLTHREFTEKYIMEQEALEKIMELRENKEKTNLEDTNANERVNYQSNKGFLSDFQEINWMSHMNPIKDQGRCGSCWAFGTTAAVEGAYSIKFGTLYNLSEQYLLDCDFTDKECRGGLPDYVLDFYMKSGVVQTSDYSYIAYPGICKRNISSKAKNILNSYKQCLYCSNDQYLDLLAQGPLVTTVDATSSPNFMLYKPDSLDTPWVPTKCSKSTDHVVTTVGAKQVNGNTLLIVRNSWGIDWGYEGYFSANINWNCNLLLWGAVPVVQNDQPFPQPQCNTYYSSCAVDSPSVSTCEGIPDAVSVLGGTIKGAKLQQSKYGGYRFFNQNNCTAFYAIKYDTDMCFANSTTNKYLQQFNSVAELIPPLGGCIKIYEGTCSTGRHVRLCRSIPNLALVPEFPTTIGGIFFNIGYNVPYNAKSITLYDQEDYKGNAVSLEIGYHFSLDSYPQFRDFIPKAKSLALIRYP